MLVPGDRTVVHHVLTGYAAAAPATNVGRGGRGGLGALGASVFESSLPGYVPGMDAHPFPDGTGVYIEPGGSFVFQVHYTPTGRETTDITRFGLYFHDKPPQQIMRNVVAINPQLSIEPNAAAHEESAYIPFDKPAIIYSLFPHAHYRGASSKFEIQYPDGRVELLLSVPPLRFQLAARLHLREAARGAGGFEDHPHDRVRQLEAESWQPGPREARALRGAVVGRDAVRRYPLPLARRDC